MRRTKGSGVRPRGNSREQGSRGDGPRTGEDLWLLEDEYDGLWTDPGDGIRRTSQPRTRQSEPPPQESPRYLQPASARSRRAAKRRRRRTIGLVRLGVAIVLAVLLVFGAFTVLRKLGAPSLEATGPPADSRLGPAQLATLTFSAEGTPADAADQRWELDGVPVRPRAAGANRIAFRPRNLRDGEHTFEIVATGGFLGSEAAKNWNFTVDTQAPKLRLDRPAVAYAWKPVKVSGSSNESATLRADDKPVTLQDGRFTLRYATPPSGPVLLTATDEVGNTSRWRMPVTLVPRLPAEPVRAVHVSADGWASSVLRQGVLRMIDDHRINAVELDLKDESGVIGWDAPVPLARRYGAITETFDLEDAVDQLHAKGVRVIGRLVAFRDPIMAEGAWNAGNREQVIQAPGGEPYAGYGGFTNFADPVVRKYNVDVAVAAAKLGVDDILYDYVRRPDGPTSSMVFPGIRGSAEDEIADFLAETRTALRPYGTFLGASVFGIAATRPFEVAQNIPKMARQVDYISAMVYPSHWGPGEYEVDDPNSQPYDIVNRSLEDFGNKVKGTGARLVPWLQDFSLGVTYGAAEVNAQIRASRDAGVNEFLLWDPEVTYSADGVPTGARMPAVGTAKVSRLPVAAPGLIRLPDAPNAVGSTTTTSTGSSLSPAAAKANELGQVPVLMFHRVTDDRDSEYDLTSDEFRATLQKLWEDGYVPVNAVDYVTRKIDIPAGKKPAVLTFDDGSETQLALSPDGVVDPDTAVGILLDFAEAHPDFRPAGTFYVNRDPFGAGSDAPRLLRWLDDNGFEIGNHTTDHEDLSGLDDAGVQQQLAEEAQIIEQAVPGYEVRTMALPFGAKPSSESLASRGSYNGASYGSYAVMLVGANPAPSPFTGEFDPANVPRIRSAQKPWRGLQENYAFDYWIGQLEGSAYVSDGDPAKVSFPESDAGALAERFRSKANPY